MDYAIHVPQNINAPRLVHTEKAFEHANNLEDIVPHALLVVCCRAVTKRTEIAKCEASSATLVAFWISRLEIQQGLGPSFGIEVLGFGVEHGVGFALEGIGICSIAELGDGGSIGLRGDPPRKLVHLLVSPLILDLLATFGLLQSLYLFLSHVFSSRRARLVNIVI